MVVVEMGRFAKCLEIRGKVGQPNELGEWECGWSDLGDDMPDTGYYQRRPRPTGQIIVRMKHYVPVNTETETRRAWRNVFADGVAHWHSLTALQKQYYNKLKQPERQSGFTRHMSKYLAQHYPPA